jgi:hypothetical protein
MTPVENFAYLTAESRSDGEVLRGSHNFNPSYLNEMPSVDRVMEAMKTNDPHETALRQIWAFYELTEIIKVLSGNPRICSHRYAAR